MMFKADSVKEFDLSRSTGCNDNPIVLLIRILNEGVHEEFAIVTKSSILPKGLVKTIASKKGYQVEVVYEFGDQIKYVFRKEASKRSS